MYNLMRLELCVKTAKSGRTLAEEKTQGEREIVERENCMERETCDAGHLREEGSDRDGKTLRDMHAGATYVRNPDSGVPILSAGRTCVSETEELWQRWRETVWFQTQNVIVSVSMGERIHRCLKWKRREDTRDRQNPKSFGGGQARRGKKKNDLTRSRQAIPENPKFCDC